MLESRRSTTLARTLGYQATMARAYNKNVRGRDLQIEDLVLRKREVLGKVGKLQHNWEGPYKVTSLSINDSYGLDTMSGEPLQRTWNARNLKKFYP